jgi:hypothetical protein
MQKRDLAAEGSGARAIQRSLTAGLLPLFAGTAAAQSGAGRPGPATASPGARAPEGAMSRT